MANLKFSYMHSHGLGEVTVEGELAKLLADFEAETGDLPADYTALLSAELDGTDLFANMLPPGRRTLCCLMQLARLYQDFPPETLKRATDEGYVFTVDAGKLDYLANAGYVRAIIAPEDRSIEISDESTGETILDGYGYKKGDDPGDILRAVASAAGRIDLAFEEAQELLAEYDTEK